MNPDLAIGLLMAVLAIGGLLMGLFVELTKHLATTDWCIDGHNRVTRAIYALPWI